VIRPARLTDLPVLCGMAAQFYEASDFGKLATLSPARVELRLCLAVMHPDCNIVLMRDDGMGMIWIELYESPVSEDLIASERIVWAHDSARGFGGGKLIAEAKKRAKAAGATMFTLSAHRDNKAASDLYERHGYQAADTMYFQRI
jgi:GNAT superfamily N-acetyltransferase